MKRRLAPAALLILVGLLAGHAGAETGGVFPYEIHRHTLANGLKVLLIPMPSEGLVSYWSVVRTGSRDEVEEGVTGFAHFFEHMMFRGSERFPADVYEGIVASMGADSNAFTSSDITAYHLAFTRDDLPRVIEIESDRFQNLAYAEDVFKTEAGAVYGEYRKNRTSPFQVLFEKLVDAAYDVHTYKHTTMGFEADIQRMPERYEYSKSFFSRFYRPENVVILVTGDFDPEQTMERLAAAYGDWRPGYVAPDVPVEPEQTAPRRVDVPFEGQTLPILAVMFKGDGLDASSRRMVSGLLLGDLLFGETAPLYKKLVLDEQRVQRLFGSFDFDRDPGLWGAIAMVKEASDVGAVEAEIWAAIERLQADGVSAQALADIRSRYRYGFLSDLTTPDEVAQNLARFAAITGDVQVVDDLFAALDEVTPEDVVEAARHYLRRERSTVATLHAADQPIPEPAPANPPVLMPVAQDPNVTFKLWFQVGSQNDPAGKEGLAALTGAMISDGGAGERSYEEILEALYPMAASYWVSVDKEMTVVRGQAHREVASRFYDLFSAAVLDPGFRAEDFERVKSDAINGIEKQLRYSSDEELGKATLYGEVFAGTPYGHLEDGRVSALEAITLDDVKSFYQEHFTRESVTMALAGSYDESLERRLIADLGRLPAGAPAAVPAPEPAAISGRRVVLVDKPGPSTAISFGYPIDVRRGSRDFYALWIANSWLGEHRNSISHLYQVIRETRGMNYGDYSYIEVFPRGGFRNMPPTGVGRRQQLFEVWIRPVPRDRAIFALRAALREVDALVRDGLTAEQVERHKEFLGKYVLQFATTTGERLGYAVDDRYYGIGGEGHLARFRETVAGITADEVNAAIRKYLQTENLVIAMVTEDAAGLKETLVSGVTTPIDYGELAKPQAVLDEDVEIAAYPLGIRAEDVKIVPVDEMFE
ncbi:MAG: insulinase family protein [Acidobacteriota bacterium]|nr:insulinase family protein [Acidobacteriota bacterium]